MSGCGLPCITLSDVCKVTNLSRIPKCVSVATNPRYDLPVATPSNQPASSTALMASRVPGYRGSSRRSVARIFCHSSEYASRRHSTSSAFASGANTETPSDKGNPTMRRTASRPRSGNPYLVKATDMHWKMACCESTNVPSQSKTTNFNSLTRFSHLLLNSP